MGMPIAQCAEEKQHIRRLPKEEEKEEHGEMSSTMKD